MTDDKKWISCQEPEKGNILRWNEPLWAAPNKPRGKRDKIGEQQVVAELINIKGTLELKVLEVKKISTGDVELKVKEGDEIRRKKTSLMQGLCEKLSEG